ncbi:hypothetical protein F1559_002479 [Cyanidiococcus yangmingshanensis]|uniref:CCT domain-containing protein n=1 Tax=Cyanidiococcus yangmingshanensis TaxID=2690220 RepID=A0A7J7ICA2_9RHOD|nr:hypothetical protein F1559_002479 [Cyanidiococcus yangmingshanensis]
MWMSPAGLDDFLSPRIDAAGFDWADLDALLQTSNNTNSAGALLTEHCKPDAEENVDLNWPGHALRRAAGRPTAGSYASLVSMEGSPRSQARSGESRLEGRLADRDGVSPLSLEPTPWLAPTSPLLDELVCSAVAGIVESEHSIASRPFSSSASDGESRRSYTAASVSCFSGEPVQMLPSVSDNAECSEHQQPILPLMLRGATPSSALSAKELRYRAYIRYREKKRQRTFRKTVRYACRKELAEARPRYKGRFVRKSELAKGDRGMHSAENDCTGVNELGGAIATTTATEIRHS